MGNTGPGGPSPAQQRRETARETVGYELWMLHRMQTQVTAWDRQHFKRDSEENLALYCAALEAFLVHARSLLCFFYRPERKTTDILADDMFTTPGTWKRPNEPPYVKEWIERMNVTLQHITSARVLPSDGWDETKIRGHIDGLFAQLNALGPDGGPIVPAHPAASAIIGPHGPAAAP